MGVQGLKGSGGGDGGIGLAVRTASQTEGGKEMVMLGGNAVVKGVEGQRVVRIAK